MSPAKHINKSIGIGISEKVKNLVKKKRFNEFLEAIWWPNARIYNILLRRYHTQPNTHEHIHFNVILMLYTYKYSSKGTIRMGERSRQWTLNHFINLTRISSFDRFLIYHFRNIFSTKISTLFSDWRLNYLITLNNIMKFNLIVPQSKFFQSFDWIFGIFRIE